MIDLDDLDALDKLHAAATPGEWLDSETGPFFRHYPVMAAEIRELWALLGQGVATEAKALRENESLRARVQELEGFLRALCMDRDNFPRMDSEQVTTTVARIKAALAPKEQPRE